MRRAAEKPGCPFTTSDILRNPGGGRERASGADGGVKIEGGGAAEAGRGVRVGCELNMDVVTKSGL